MSNTANEIRLVIADDHPIVRQGLRQAIESDAQLKVIAEAGDGQTALERIQTLRPDVAILDLDMPKMDGFAVMRALAEGPIIVAIIILTVHCEPEFFHEALQLGARGYVLKDSAATDIVSGIKAVAAGQHYTSPALTSLLIGRKQTAPKTQLAQPRLTQLTAAERQILKLIADYKTNKDIAETLFISPLTVKTHRQNICAKLELQGNHALMRFALEHKEQL